MALWVLRAFFLLVCAGAGWQSARMAEFDPFWGMLLGIAMFTSIFALETIFAGKESLANLLAIVFGITVGVLLAVLAINITTLVLPSLPTEGNVTGAIRIILTAMLCYLCTMIVIRTRDRFRFVIPYVDFKRESKGHRAFLLDTSVLIDGRIGGLCHTGFFDAPLYVPDFILEELHQIADSADRLRRVRGRRGLGLVNQLQRSREADVSVYEVVEGAGLPADSRLVRLARELDAHICTTDANLTRVARAQGVAVLNLNELANALRPSVIPGETISVRLVRRGEESGQAVGFLDDGTMVVVEQAEDRVGAEPTVEIVRVLQKSSGRIIFGKLQA